MGLSPLQVVSPRGATVSSSIKWGSYMCPPSRVTVMKRGDLARHLCQHLCWQLHPHDLRYQLLLWNYHPPSALAAIPGLWHPASAPATGPRRWWANGLAGCSVWKGFQLEPNLGSKLLNIVLQSVCDLMLSLEILRGLSPMWTLDILCRAAGNRRFGERSADLLSSLPRTWWDHNHAVKRKEIGNFPKENVLSI